MSRDFVAMVIKFLLPGFQLINMMLQVEMALTQACLESNNGDIPFEDLGNDANPLPSGSQAIITSYQFQCCGRVTRWQTRMQPGGHNHRTGVYSITFQVWRPGPAAESDGCYSLVGEDVYNDVRLSETGRLANRTVDPSTDIFVQPGDVVGYYVVSVNGGDEGIQLDDSRPEESVWYTSESISMKGDCPFSVGDQAGRTLSSPTEAAPVMSIDIESSACTEMLTTAVTTHNTTSLLPTFNNMPTATPSPQASESESPPGDQGNPKPSGLSVRDIALTAGGSVLAGLVLLIGTISVAVLVHRKRGVKKASSGGQDMEMKQNVAYVATPERTSNTIIAINPAYGRNTNYTRYVEDQHTTRENRGQQTTLDGQQTTFEDYDYVIH